MKALLVPVKARSRLCQGSFLKKRAHHLCRQEEELARLALPEALALISTVSPLFFFPFLDRQQEELARLALPEALELISSIQVAPPPFFRCVLLSEP